MGAIAKEMQDPRHALPRDQDKALIDLDQARLPFAMCDTKTWFEPCEIIQSRTIDRILMTP